MRKRCTICGQGLRLWDRMQGRFDHPGCRERSIVKLPCDNNQPELPFLKPNAIFKFAQTFHQSARTSR
jgi:hypothetical protein